MAQTLFPSDLWHDVCAVRGQHPLVHSITNLVVMNFNANVLLAMGAAPVMAHAHEEVAEMAAIAQALVLNIGTLEPYWIESMRQALAVAAQRGIKTVLDPVGAGATSYRNESIAALLEVAMPSVIRGNASEIMSVAGSAVRTRGVDSAAAASDALQVARNLAQQTGAVVCISGAVDHVFDASGRHANLANGHEWMTRITGVGCSASALVGAFCAVQPDAWRATVSAMAYLGVAGEVAATQVIAQGGGVGSLQIALLDHLQLLDQATFENRLKMTFSPGKLGACSYYKRSGYDEQNAPNAVPGAAPVPGHRPGRAAWPLPVNYLGVSPVFATPTKQDTAPPWGLDGLRQVRAMTDLPLVAIGGIQLHNAPAVLQAVADGLAVVSALCSADAPALAARSFRQFF